MYHSWYIQYGCVITYNHLTRLNHLSRSTELSHGHKELSLIHLPKFFHQETTLSYTQYSITPFYLQWHLVLRNAQWPLNHRGGAVPSWWCYRLHYWWWSIDRPACRVWTLPDRNTCSTLFLLCPCWCSLTLHTTSST